MKQLINIGLVVILAISLTGCYSLNEHKEFTYVNGIDFRPYLAKGFAITPYRYTEPCSILGIYSVTIYPEVKKISGYGTDDPGKYEYVEFAGDRYLIAKINKTEALTKAVEVMQSHEADILMDFNISLKRVDYYVYAYEIYGVIAKRK